MSARFRLCCGGLAATFFFAVISAQAADKPVVPPSPRVEVVFCLDTTGSMGGLIQGAKEKIWAICNQIASGKPTPQLKVGLIGYRDRGDEYISQVFDLTEDLDAIHGHLAKFAARGGGDGPESVNQALDDAVNKVKWSADKDTLKVIFLVGDAPPHMDYPDDVKYPVTCQKAAVKEIIINTIQCGADPNTQKIWKDICVKAEGSYVQIQQDGGVVAAVPTPFDKRLAEINADLARTTLTFGDRRNRADGEAKKEAAAGLAAPAAAERAAFTAKAGRVAAYDLLENIKAGKVKLEELKKEELPEELRELNMEQRKEYLAKLEKQRADLAKEALDLDKKRLDFIAKKQAENKPQNGFDNQVLEVLRKQAKKYKIEY